MEWQNRPGPPSRHANHRGVFISQPRKVSLFVDVQNIYYTCRQAYQANIDYNKFWAEITG